MRKNKNIFTNQPSKARKLAAGATVLLAGAGAYAATQTESQDNPKQGKDTAVCSVTVKSGDTVSSILHKKLKVPDENKLDVVDPITGKAVSPIEQETRLLPGSEVLAVASPDVCRAIGAKVIPIHVEDPQAVREAIQEMTPQS